ncbi:no significant blast hit, RIC1 superfamily domain-containing protein [Histoplasma capsulatum G186AR]|uniref:RIC1 superfamily domain-containing protein n=1 Tax=Ajellomyces capsulatus TaxID=5037 RepID=A0A8H8CV88_AJECA|nr:RIC1 superfamily domain-containing protein [Histoplasma capsulatum]QSS72902.1 no significant blast hit, RIC1 superfamily domain-containing protein [Histoplasma capsulatum G186AR]
MMEICLPLRCLVSQTWLPVTDTARNCVLFVLCLHGANSTTWNSYTRMFRSPLPVVPISDVALRFLKAARRRVWDLERIKNRDFPDRTTVILQLFS